MQSVISSFNGEVYTYVVKEQQVCHIVLSVSVFGFLAQMRTLQKRTPTTTKVVPLSSATLSG